MSTTPLSDKALSEDLPKFIEQLKAKLEKGKLEYGDSSIEGKAEMYIAELQMECLDLAGWGFLLFCKLERMSQRLGSLNRDA